MLTINELIAECISSSVLEPSSCGWWVLLAILVPVIVVVLVVVFPRKRLSSFRQEKIGDGLSLSVAVEKNSGSQELNTRKEIDFVMRLPIMRFV